MIRGIIRVALVLSLLLPLCMVGCGGRVDMPETSPERTAAFWTELQKILAILGPRVREPEAAERVSKKLEELVATTRTMHKPDKPDQRLVRFASDLAPILHDYGRLIDSYQTLSKLVLANKANNEERDAFITSLDLFVKLDKNFSRTQEKLEKHRITMEKQYGLSLPPHELIRQNFME